MKILHIIPTMGSGGAEKMLYRIVKNSPKGICNTILVIDEVGFYENELTKYNVKVIECKLKTALKSPKQLFKLHVQFKKIICDTDIVNCWMYHANIIGYFYGRRYGKPVFWGIRRSYVNKDKMKLTTYLVIKLNVFLSKRVNTVIYNSFKGIETHEQIGFSEKQKIFIPNGFECSNPFVINERKKRDATIKIINVARWEILKDHETLLKSLAYLKENYQQINFQVSLCGKNIDAHNPILKEMLLKYNLNTEVSLLGERDDIDELMQKSDIYISSSISEGFPNVIAEAMLNGLICIVTNAGDSSKIMHNDQFVVDVGNYKNIARLINDVCSLSDVAFNTIKKQNQDWIVQNYPIEKTVNKFIEVFKNEYSRD